MSCSCACAWPGQTGIQTWPGQTGTYAYAQHHAAAERGCDRLRRARLLGARGCAICGIGPGPGCPAVLRLRLRLWLLLLLLPCSLMRMLMLTFMLVHRICAAHASANMVDRSIAHAAILSISCVDAIAA